MAPQSTGALMNFCCQVVVIAVFSMTTAGSAVAQNAPPGPVSPPAVPSSPVSSPPPASAALQAKLPSADDREFMVAQAHFYARNYQDAYLRLLPLAHRGHTDAEYLLGVMSDNGAGPVQLNPADANYWYRLAAEKGHPEAQFALSNAYANGRGGLPISPADMLMWLRKSAESRYMPAMISLAALYDYGMGVPRNIDEGTIWVKNAADAGSVNATYQYARRLETGFGVRKDMSAAVEWYRRAARRGHPAAQLWLGSIADGSLASSQQNVDALVWLNLAVRNGTGAVKTAAQERSRELQKNMMPGDIAEAQTRARAWKAIPQFPGLQPDPEYDLPGGLAAQQGKTAQPRRGGS